MGDRKRPNLLPGEKQEGPSSKAPRREGQEAQRGGQVSTQPARGRGTGRRGRRGRGSVSRGVSRNAPLLLRPAPNAPLGNDANRLVSAVTCSSLFYEGCRSPSLDAFPEHVPLTFPDPETYVRTFLPFLYEEAREVVKASFAETREQDQYWEARVLSVDALGGGWVKIDISIGNFCGRHASHQRLFQNHIAVLTSLRPSKRDPVEHLQKRIKKQMSAGRSSGGSPVTVIVAVMVQLDREQNLMTLRTKPVCEQHLSDPTSPCHEAIDNLRHHPESWYLFPTGGLVTQQRECDILHALEKIPVLPALLRPDEVLKMPLRDVPRKAPIGLGQGILDCVQQNYDASQADAIFMCIAHFCKDEIESGQQTLPVLLIQGPPGTGKTHTVQGILNLWHLVQFEKYYKCVIGQYEQADASSVKKAELATARNRMKPRILVCAPSNAAVDELLERILVQGFRDSAGQRYRPNLIRIGAEDAQYSDDVRMVFLDTLVMSYMSLSQQDWVRNYERHQQKIEVLEKEITELEQAIFKGDKSLESLGGELISKMEKLDKSETERNRLKIVECIVNGASPNDRHIREALELSFLDTAEMVFTTLSSTGKKILSKVNRGFETVLIDEAAQAAEVSTLQPLIYGCQQCVLVGDPQQLPATVISQRGKDLNMERSLFQRLQEAGAPVKLLQTQYRMHPFIRSFPSGYFYGNKLEDAQSVLERPLELFYSHDLLKPYVVFDVPTGMHQRQGGGSLQNQVEADLACALFKELRDFLIEKQKQAAEEGKPPPRPVRVGVVTPYRSQTKCLTETFLRVLGAAVTSEVQIATVDSCQGKQLDVIIFSCVRGSTKTSSMGFVADIRRMNVAITRAKKALWILGNFRTLVAHPAWAALEKDAEERECIVQDSTAQSLFPHQYHFQDPSPEQSPELEYRDPRVGIIKPLAEEAANVEFSEPEATSQSTEESEVPLTEVMKVDNAHKALESMCLEDLKVLQDAVSTALVSRKSTPAAQGQTQPSTEQCSGSTATSQTGRQVSENSQSKESMLVVRQQGAPTTIAPSRGGQDSYLVVDTPNGVVSLPVEVLYSAQRGFDPTSLQAEVPGRPSGSSDVTSSILQFLNHRSNP